MSPGHKMLTTEQHIRNEMSQLVEQFDWAGTSLGAAQLWNPSLQSAVRLCLASKSPILIVGGADMIQIYNAAFAAMIGSRHPSALGERASDFWRDQWSEFGPIANRVWSEGESVLMENHRFMLTRNGYPQEAYFTTSYTPISDELGIHGIFVSITDTTELITKDQHLKYLRNQLVASLFMQAPMALCTLQGPKLIIEIANERMLKLWDRSLEEVLNRPVFEAVPEFANKRYEKILNQVLTTGEKVVIREGLVTLKREGANQEIYVKMVLDAIREPDNSISGVMILAEEVTKDVILRRQTEESEIRQKLAIEAAAIGTFDWNLITSDFQFSDRLAQIFGFSNARSADHTILINRIHPNDRPIRDEAYRSALVTGNLAYESRLVWDDKSIHWVRMNGMIVYDDSGKPLRMYGTALDITEQRMLTEHLEELIVQRTESLEERNSELKSSEERFHKMVEEVQDYAIILLDRDGIIRQWNKGAEQIKRYKEEEIIGKHFGIFYLPNDRAQKLPEKLINEALQNDRATHEGWRVRKDGTQFWGSVVITALHDENNEIIGFSKVTRDLTERRLAEEKMVAYTIELEIQNKELEQFAYIASHDLQEPLRKIRTFSELIQQNLDDRLTTKRYFDKINASAHRMSELIRSVLSYSRTSRDEDQFERTDLNMILRNVLVDLELIIEEKKATVIYEILPEVSGLPIQLGQLFTNLISNALKFTQEIPVVRITSTEMTRDAIASYPSLSGEFRYTMISVSDNGIGFDQQYEKKIFTMFQRLHRREQYAGTGIGLALCKKIVENHHGAIGARSIQGHGTTFDIALRLMT